MTVIKHIKADNSVRWELVSGGYSLFVSARVLRSRRLFWKAYILQASNNDDISDYLHTFDALTHLERGQTWGQKVEEILADVIEPGFS